MTAKPSIFSRAVGFVVPVGVGALALAGFVWAKKSPDRRPLDEEGRAVRVLVVPTITATPRATGYGVVQSKRQWDMVAEVSGRVIELNDQLETGRVIPKGTTLIKLDPADYELSAEQQKATVNNSKAQLGELSTRERNTKASLAIAKRTLELAQKEYNQTKTLVSSGNATTSELDSGERQVLNAKASVQSYQSTLAELPAKRRALRAQIDQLNAGLSGAKLEVERTELEAPFDIRVRSVAVELRELVTAGSVLAVGDGIDVAEVPAQFSIGALAPLIRSGARAQEPTTPSANPLDRLRLSPNLEATVRLESGQLKATWEARVDRFANVDSQTRTVSVVIAVDEPFRRAQIGVQPPLVAGMYVEVELRGKPVEGCRAVPRGALHGKRVYIADTNNRLAIREVETSLQEADFVCVAGGIEEGERVVLTDLSPAIDGMLLDPRVDEAAGEALASTGSGEAEAL